MGLELKVTIDEVGFGGFRVKSAAAFELNADYTFLVSTRAGDKVRRVDGTARHCRAIPAGQGTLFETGFAFTEGFQSTAGIEAIIGSVPPARRSPGRVRVRVVSDAGSR